MAIQLKKAMPCRLRQGILAIGRLSVKGFARSAPLSRIGRRLPLFDMGTTQVFIGRQTGTVATDQPAIVFLDQQL